MKKSQILTVVLVILTAFIGGFYTGMSYNSAAAYIQEATGQRKYLKEGDIIREPDGLCGYLQPKTEK